MFSATLMTVFFLYYISHCCFLLVCCGKGDSEAGCWRKPFKRGSPGRAKRVVAGLELGAVFCALRGPASVLLFSSLQEPCTQRLAVVYPVCVPVVSSSATLWTVTCQAPLSMNSPGKNSGDCHACRAFCHVLLQGISLTQGSNPHPYASWIVI